MKHTVSVLGPFSLQKPDGTPVGPLGRKESAIIAMLALTPRHRQTRAWLQEKLWGDRAPIQAASNLRQSLSKLRGILNAERVAIEADRTWVWLNADAFVFTHLGAGARGEVLSGFDLEEEAFEDWLREARAAFGDESSGSYDYAQPQQPGANWIVETLQSDGDDPVGRDMSRLLSLVIIDAARATGITLVAERRGQLAGPEAMSTITVRPEVLSIAGALVVSATATDVFGFVKWHRRVELETSSWFEFRGACALLAHRFADFALRTEMHGIDGGTPSLDSDACFAMFGLVLPGSVPVDQIVRHCKAAIENTNSAVAHVMLGQANLQKYGERHQFSPQDADEIMQNIGIALRLEPDNPVVNAIAGHINNYFVRDFNKGCGLIENALASAPNNAFCWTYKAVAQNYSGDAVGAEASANEAIARCAGTVFEPKAKASKLFSLVMKGDYDAAITIGESIVDQMNFRPVLMNLMTAYVYAGRHEEGILKLEALKRREKDLCIDMIKSPEYPIVNRMHRDAIFNAAQEVGLK